MTHATNNLASRIAAAVERQRERMLDTLQRLVHIPSVTGDEAAVQSAVEGLFHARGLEVDRWEAASEEVAPYSWHIGDERDLAGRPNLAGVRRGTGGGRSLLLNAHVDTVEAGDPSQWSLPPFSGTLIDGRLYGRGSCDMKGGLVSYLMALDMLDELGIRLKGDVTLSATVGEENGGVGALSTILRGYHADAVLIAEPTRLALVPAQGGSLVARVIVQGKSAHGAVRDEGVSAVEKFIPIFLDLLKFERERNAALDHPLYRHLNNKVPISIGVVQAGNWASTVPERLIAEGRIGLLPGEDVDDFREQVTARIASVAARDSWLREHQPVVEWFGGQFAPCETPLDAPLCQAVAGAHLQATGRAPFVEGVPYGADMRLFTLIGGLPCVMYGAGDVRVAHHADEFIELAELATAVRTMTYLLIDWCGVNA